MRRSVTDQKIRRRHPTCPPGRFGHPTQPCIEFLAQFRDHHQALTTRAARSAPMVRGGNPMVRQRWWTDRDRLPPLSTGGYL